MKKVILLLLVLLSVNLTAQQKTKVACIGNSVTYGYLLPEREKNSYPAQLQNLLGDNYEVKNFGRSSATLLSKGHLPYINQPEYKKALEYAADIVVIHLGLNDTDPRNWPNYKDFFFKDYVDLVNSFRKQNPNTKIFICRLSPIFSGHFRFISGTRDWHREIQSVIESIAQYTGVELIDLETPLHSRPDLFPDDLHPTVQGAGILAKTVYSALAGDFGELQMPILYSNNMILQRNRYLNITGTANKGDQVSVKIGTQTHKTVTDNFGKWQVTLNPLSTGEKYTLEISTPSKTLKYKNVLAGEVWLCSGQSNMFFKLKDDYDYRRNKGLKDYKSNKNIRIYDMAPRWETYETEWDSTAMQPLNDLDYFEPTTWKELTDCKIEEFSAISYYFGEILSDSLDVPIGLIHNSIGGSNIESWIDRETLEVNIPAIFNNWKKNDFIQEWARNRAIKNTKKSDKKIQRHPYEPSYLFESGIMPLKDYTINGVIWYQGESNEHNFDVYEKLFPLFVKSWRQNWDNPKLPFYYVQLSSINRPSWTWFRDTQRRLMDSVPNTYMAVSSDKGDSLDVHPPYKKIVATRLGKWALNKTYNFENITPSGPLFRSADFYDGYALVSFDYADGMTASDGEEIIGFEIAEVDGLFYPAKAVVQGNQIRVLSPDVKKPTLVRYAWQPFTRANLVNRDNLPASTFRAEKTNLKNMNGNIKTERLPNYPIKGGVSGVSIGVHNNRLIVAGGCNFPKVSAAAGGEKVFYKDVYMLNIESDIAPNEWIKCKPFIHEVAYGASVNTDKGIVFIGGQNKKGSLSSAILVAYDDKKDELTYTKLPDLPVGHFNGDATIADNIIYVAGGSFSDNAKGDVYFLDMNNTSKGWSKVSVPSEYERQQPILFTHDSKVLIAGGYDEKAAKAFTDILVHDTNKNQWIKYANITPQEPQLRTFVGASSINYENDQVVFAGGVNYERFTAALERIKKTQEASKSDNQVLLATLLETKDKYMTQAPEWYRFNKTLLLFDHKSKEWSSLGEYDQLARAGAGITMANDKLYIICGELKPGIRTEESSCIILK